MFIHLYFYSVQEATAVSRAQSAFVIAMASASGSIPPLFPKNRLQDWIELILSILVKLVRNLRREFSLKISYPELHINYYQKAYDVTKLGYCKNGERRFVLIPVILKSSLVSTPQPLKTPQKPLKLVLMIWNLALGK